MRRLTLVLGLAALAVVQGGAAAQARTPASDAVARAAIAEIRSPYCPGLMLEVCPSPPADLLRDSIRTMAAAGVGAGEIVEDVLARHGEEWRAVPRRSGAGLWAWLLPPLALLGGIGAVVFTLRSLQRRRQWRAEPAGLAISAEDRAAVEAALRDWERVEAAAE